MTDPWNFLAVKIGDSEAVSRNEVGFKSLMVEMQQYFDMTVSQVISARQPVKVIVLCYVDYHKALFLINWTFLLNSKIIPLKYKIARVIYNLYN